MVLAITGGGSGAIADLLEVPGGSRTVLEAVVPYSAAALVEFLRGKPEQFCSARTARAMAMAAFQRAGICKATPASWLIRSRSASDARPAWPATGRSVGRIEFTSRVQTAEVTVDAFAGTDQRPPRSDAGGTVGRRDGAERRGRGVEH